MRTFAVIVVVGLLNGPFGASRVEAADVTIPVRVYINKPASKTKFVSKGAFALPDANTDNPANDGATITFSEGGTSETISLPAANWSALGNPAGSKGFKYKDPTGATCRTVLLKGTTIKGLCKATAAGAPSYDAGSDPPISIVLAIGTAPQRYCAECPNGGIQKGNAASLTKMKDCGAPLSCSDGPSTPTLTPPHTPTHTPTRTHTETPTPTATEITGPTCCEGGSVCSGAPAESCASLGETPVGGGTMCVYNFFESAGRCEEPTFSLIAPADCCEFSSPFSYCTISIDQATCEGNDGTYVADAIGCDQSGLCVACGNNRREGNEQCDGTDATACPGECQSNCQCAPPTCPASGGDPTACNALVANQACEDCCTANTTCFLGCFFAGGCSTPAGRDACGSGINAAGCGSVCCP